MLNNLRESGVEMPHSHKVVRSGAEKKIPDSTGLQVWGF
jgi:hypothetical protein